MNNISSKKLVTVFLLKCGILVGIILPVLADTSEQDRQSNINYAALLVISLIGVGVSTGGLAFQLKKAQSYRKKLAEELANSNLQITQLKTDYNKKDDRVKELKSLLEKQKMNVDRQMKLEQQLQQEINQIQLKIKQLEEADRTSQETLLSKEVEITTLAAQLKQQKSQFYQKAADIEKQLADKDSQLDLQNKSLENLQQIINQTQLKIEQLEESERNSQAAISNKKNEIAKLQEQLKQQESELSENIAKLEKELADRNSQFNLQSDKIKNAERQINYNQLKIKQLEQSDRSLQ